VRTCRLAGQRSPILRDAHADPLVLLPLSQGDAGPDAAPSRATAPLAGSYELYRAELDSFSQVSQIRDFIALLPRRKWVGVALKSLSLSASADLLPFLLRICNALIERYFEGFNAHSDIIYRPDFQAKVGRGRSVISRLCLTGRSLSLKQYDRFWRRSLDKDDIAQIDLRWLAGA
jgi:hypothetical protein